MRCFNHQLQISCQNWLHMSGFFSSQFFWLLHQLNLTSSSTSQMQMFSKGFLFTQDSRLCFLNLKRCEELPHLLLAEVMARPVSMIFVLMFCSIFGISSMDHPWHSIHSIHWIYSIQNAMCAYIYIFYLYIYHPAQIPSTSRQPISWTWKPPLVVWWTSLEDSWPHEKHIESTALWSQASRFDGALLEKRRGKNSDFRFGVFSLNALFSPIWNLHTLTLSTHFMTISDMARPILCRGNRKRSWNRSPG